MTESSVASIWKAGLRVTKVSLSYLVTVTKRDFWFKNQLWENRLSNTWHMSILFEKDLELFINYKCGMTAVWQHYQGVDTSLGAFIGKCSLKTNKRAMLLCIVENTTRTVEHSILFWCQTLTGYLNWCPKDSNKEVRCVKTISSIRTSHTKPAATYIPEHDCLSPNDHFWESETFLWFGHYEILSGQLSLFISNTPW